MDTVFRVSRGNSYLIHLNDGDLLAVRYRLEVRCDRTAKPKTRLLRCNTVDSVSGDDRLVTSPHAKVSCASAVSMQSITTVMSTQTQSAEQTKAARIQFWLRIQF